MDAERFDAVSRFLGSSGTRRRALASLLGGALGLPGLLRADDAWAKSGKCKKPCGQCTTCKKGKCVRTSRGTRCKPGKCVSVRNGNGCPGGTCLDGRCTPFPAPSRPCRNLRESCAGDCCAGLVCDYNGCNPGTVCVRPIGQPCDADTCNCSFPTQKCSPETGTCRACVFVTEACAIDDDCCFGDSCGTSATGDPSVCCYNQGNPNCQSDSECCAGLKCEPVDEFFGTCVPV